MKDLMKRKFVGMFLCFVMVCGLVGSVHADTFTGLPDITVVGDAIVDLTYNGTKYVVADGDLALGTTTRWWMNGAVPTLWQPGDPGKAGDVGANADNFLMLTTPGGAVNISSLDDLAFQETIFDFPTNTFFLFERGGNDSGSWQAINADGSAAGPVVPFSGATDYADTPYSSGQNVAGVAFETDQLVWGVRINSPGHDTHSISTPALRLWPEAINPELGEKNAGPNETFEWTFVGDVQIVEYYLYLGTDENLAGPLLIDGASVSPTSGAEPSAQYTYNGIEEDTTYYWQVIANAMEPNGVIPGLYDKPVTVEGLIWSFEGISNTPEILTDPVDQYVVPDPDTHLLTGEPVTLSVEFLTGKAFSVEWLKDGAPVDEARTDASITTDADISISVLTIISPAEADQGVYSCIVQLDSPTPPATGTATSGEGFVYVTSESEILAHRWSFNGTDASALVDMANPGDVTLDAQIVDPDDQNIFLLGSEVQFGGRLEEGDNSNSADPNAHFIDLRNNIISELGNDMALMIWFTWESASDWQRVYDFGISAGGEGVSEPSPNEDYIELTPRAGGSGSPMRLEAHIHPNVNLDHTSTAPLNEEICVLISWESANNEFRMYVDGEYISTATLPEGKPLSSLNDLNCWLGRSSYNNDLFRGKINEFRIYSMPMNDAWAEALYDAGPDGDAVNVDPCVAPLDPKFDTNKDCVVDLADLADFLTRTDNGWLSCGLGSCL